MKIRIYEQEWAKNPVTPEEAAQNMMDTYNEALKGIEENKNPAGWQKEFERLMNQPLVEEELWMHQADYDQLMRLFRRLKKDE